VNSTAAIYALKRIPVDPGIVPKLFSREFRAQVEGHIRAELIDQVAHHYVTDNREWPVLMLAPAASEL